MEGRRNADVAVGPAPATVSPWTREGLLAAQREDTDIGFIIEKIGEKQEKPTRKSVTLKSHDVKTMWVMWERLSIRDDMLKRRFEANDGLGERWQIIWPKKLRTEFLQMAHGGMTGVILAADAPPQQCSLVHIGQRGRQT